MESPRTALAVVPFAAAVAYSRVHVGVHWTSDVVVGAAVGTGVALRPSAGGRCARRTRRGPGRSTRVPELPDGEGLLMLVSNQRSGDPDHDPADELEAALPQAVVVRADPDRALDDQLDEAIERAGDEALAVGVAGGDGSVAAAAAVAGGAGCRSSWSRPAPSTTSPATSACTTCRRRWTPPAPGRRWPWTSRSSTCTPAAATTPSRPR